MDITQFGFVLLLIESTSYLSATSVDLPYKPCQLRLLLVNPLSFA